MVYCTKCGGSMEDNAANCPYCGAINFVASEKEYMDTLEEVRKRLAEMGDDSQEEFTTQVKKGTSLFVKIAIWAAAILLVLFASLFLIRKVLLDRDARQAKERYEWKNEMYPKLDEMYSQEDYDGILTFLNENISDKGYYPYDWRHFHFVSDFYQYYKNFLTDKDLGLDIPRNAAWILYDYFGLLYNAGRGYFELTSKEEELQDAYLQEEETFIQTQMGFSEDEINGIMQLYEKMTDPEYKIRLDEIEKYLKENTHYGR